GIRAKRLPMVEEPVLSIREIPTVPPAPKAPPSEPRPLIPTEIPQTAFDGPAALARAQRLVSRVNLSRIVAALLSLTHRMEDHRDLSARLGKDEAELRDVAATLADRPEGLSL